MSDKSRSHSPKGRARQGRARLLPLWAARLGLMLLTAGLLTLALAPAEQFYLAYVALVPWLLAVRGLRRRSAAAWGFLGGAAAFAANLWWLSTVTVNGTVAMVLYFALFWGAIAAGLAGAGGLREDAPPRSIVGALLLIPATWVGVEWLRTVVIPWAVPILFFPWVQVGFTQSPAPVLCQVADFAGVPGVSFVVVLVNAMAALAMVHRRDLRRLAPAGALTAAVLAGAAGYGAFRLGQQTTSPGPRVMLVQSNHAHAPGGARRVTPEDSARWHLAATRAAAAAAPYGNEAVDLVVWSEAAVPPVNDEAMRHLARAPIGQVMREVRDGIAGLTRSLDAGLLAGGFYVGGWTTAGATHEAGDVRNAVYFFDRGGSLRRYDKVHLVPFSEHLPFRESAPRLFRLLLWFGATSAERPLVAGQRLEVMQLAPRTAGAPEFRFVAPICLENVNPLYLASAFRPGAGDGGAKGADLIVNVSNDGWFGRVEKAQHLQACLFRCIETRAPMARASNTGISAAIDSCGRIDPGTRMDASAEGTRVATLRIDRRVTLYSRWGDVFAAGCLAAIVLECTRVAVHARRARRDSPVPV